MLTCLHTFSASLIRSTSIISRPMYTGCADVCFGLEMNRKSQKQMYTLVIIDLYTAHRKGINWFGVRGRWCPLHNPTNRIQLRKRSMGVGRIVSDTYICLVANMKTDTGYVPGDNHKMDRVPLCTAPRAFPPMDHCAVHLTMASIDDVCDDYGDWGLRRASMAHCDNLMSDDVPLSDLLVDDHVSRDDDVLYQYGDD